MQDIYFHSTSLCLLALQRTQTTLEPQIHPTLNLVLLGLVHISCTCIIVISASSASSTEPRMGDPSPPPSSQTAKTQSSYIVSPPQQSYALNTRLPNGPASSVYPVCYVLPLLHHQLEQVGVLRQVVVVLCYTLGVLLPAVLVLGTLGVDLLLHCQLEVVLGV